MCAIDRCILPSWRLQIAAHVAKDRDLASKLGCSPAEAEAKALRVMLIWGINSWTYNGHSALFELGSKPAHTCGSPNLGFRCATLHTLGTCTVAHTRSAPAPPTHPAPPLAPAYALLPPATHTQLSLARLQGKTGRYLLDRSAGPWTLCLIPVSFHCGFTHRGRNSQLLAPGLQSKGCFVALRDIAAGELLCVSYLGGKASMQSTPARCARWDPVAQHLLALLSLSEMVIDACKHMKLPPPCLPQEALLDAELWVLVQVPSVQQGHGYMWGAALPCLLRRHAG